MSDTASKKQNILAHKYEEPECKSRACFDAASWVSKFGKTSKDTEVSSLPVKATSKECPLDKDELGRHTWGFLHTMAANYPEQPSEQQQRDMKDMMHLFSKFYPCNYCAEDLRETMKKYEPQTGSQEDFSQWMCKMHNIVNVKLGKPEFDCGLVNQRWRDGWKDGSCD
ncbi:FAD-linked sulfhydryl oxidase ALR-like [Dreissena polymorpha]|uniref:Sulfhydryl oxidase n=1 Tax=Dreissena polymorpha TaxID=45954 RepID=A0A9D4RCT1_DREPO|nr:FAD-linked sulfhydryl oxidase ALR-like [Dreissena polymorpha]KAH3861947.1 hypothetical protein DPMN_024901 [Dreissena polymorpha]